MFIKEYLIKCLQKDILAGEWVIHSKVSAERRHHLASNAKSRVRIPQNGWKYWEYWNGGGGWKVDRTLTVTGFVCSGVQIAVSYMFFLYVVHYGSDTLSSYYRCGSL